MPAMMPTDTAEILVQDLSPACRTLRVAVVTETYPPEVNGVAATLSRVVDGLRQRGHAVQLVRPRQTTDEGAGAEHDAAVLMRGLPLPRYPQLRMGLPARRALVKLWTQRRPDVVHVVTEGPLGWSALQAALHLRLPVVSDFRTNFHAYSGHYGLKWLRSPIVAYLRRFHNRCACTMVPTEALRSELHAAGFRGLRVVARGVDTALFTPTRRSDTLRAQWGCEPSTPVVLYVGRLAPEKNLGVLMAAFDRLSQFAPTARLLLVGDGPDRAALQRRCPGAIFAGVQRGEALAAHYASADLFVFPSLTETWGNVVSEAMASGLAVMAYDTAAAGHLIRHGHNGLLAPPGDEDAFVALARRLVGEPDRARDMSEQARATACWLDWGRVVDAVEAEYLAAMSVASTPDPAIWRAALPAA